MIKCLIVDDEPVAIKVLEKLVSKVSDLQVVATCSSAIEAKNILSESNVDLIFLDIEMPGMNGLEFLATLDQSQEVIVVTGKDKYALDAFDYEVSDFLVKPTKEARFIKAIDRIRKKLAAKQVSAAATIFVKHQRRFINLPVENILFVEALGDYVNIHTKTDKLTIYSTLKELMAKLPASKFIQIHRSNVVQVERIGSIEDNHVVIGDHKLRISRSHKDAVKSKLAI